MCSADMTKILPFLFGWVTHGPSKHHTSEGADSVVHESDAKEFFSNKSFGDVSWEIHLLSSASLSEENNSNKLMSSKQNCDSDQTAKYSNYSKINTEHTRKGLK